MKKKEKIIEWFNETVVLKGIKIRYNQLFIGWMLVIAATSMYYVLSSLLIFVGGYESFLGKVMIDAMVSILLFGAFGGIILVLLIPFIPAILLIGCAFDRVDKQ